jgi:DNA polymerase III epsilon subunit-like protein
MARKTKTAAALATIRARRQTEDGRACIDIAERLIEAPPEGASKLDALAEARQWVKLGLEHDKAKDSVILAEMREKLAKKGKRTEGLSKLQEGKHLEVVQGGAS